MSQFPPQLPYLGLDGGWYPNLKSHLIDRFYILSHLYVYTHRAYLYVMYVYITIHTICVNRRLPMSLIFRGEAVDGPDAREETGQHGYGWIESANTGG